MRPRRRIENFQWSCRESQKIRVGGFRSCQFWVAYSKASFTHGGLNGNLPKFNLPMSRTPIYIGSRIITEVEASIWGPKREPTTQHGDLPSTSFAAAVPGILAFKFIGFRA